MKPTSQTFGDQTNIVSQVHWCLVRQRREDKTVISLTTARVSIVSVGVCDLLSPPVSPDYFLSNCQIESSQIGFVFSLNRHTLAGMRRLAAGAPIDHCCSYCSINLHINRLLRHVINSIFSMHSRTIVIVSTSVQLCYSH